MLDLQDLPVDQPASAQSASFREPWWTTKLLEKQKRYPQLFFVFPDNGTTLLIWTSLIGGVPGRYAFPGRTEGFHLVPRHIVDLHVTSLQPISSQSLRCGLHQVVLL